MTQRSSKRIPKAQIGSVTAQEDAYVRGLLVYEDAEILVFNKPSGLAVQGGSGVALDMDRLMWAFANRKGRRPKLVHRLDRDTSGILVVAKTTPAAAHLSRQFAERTTEKIYVALVSGQPSQTHGVIDAPLLRYTSAGTDLVRVVPATTDGAQAAQTSWRLLAGSAKASVIEANPHTGRMHQIRAHLAHLGQAILGDTKYGGLLVLGAVIIPRLMLHARQLSFTHPMTGIRMSFEAPLPDDFLAIIGSLGLCTPAS
jgi:23S rRNA pseudouridine955/2504/2580 synthase